MRAYEDGTPRTILRSMPIDCANASADQRSITTTRQNVDSRVKMPHGSHVQVLHGFRVADSVDRIISIISLSL